jgi:hypothetical protein
MAPALLRRLRIAHQCEVCRSFRSPVIPLAVALRRALYA